MAWEPWDIIMDLKREENDQIWTLDISVCDSSENRWREHGSRGQDTSKQTGSHLGKMRVSG